MWESLKFIIKILEIIVFVMISLILIVYILRLLLLYITVYSDYINKYYKEEILKNEKKKFSFMGSDM